MAAIAKGNLNQIKENHRIMLFYDKLRQDGQSLLMVAIEKDQMEIVKYLLSSSSEFGGIQHIDLLTDIK